MEIDYNFTDLNEQPPMKCYENCDDSEKDLLTLAPPLSPSSFPALHYARECIGDFLSLD